MENFDFKSLFSTIEEPKQLDFSTPPTIVKKEVVSYKCSLPESCIQLDGLRELKNALRWG
jgi:hypothetical protein